MSGSLARIPASWDIQELLRGISVKCDHYYCRLMAAVSFSDRYVERGGTEEGDALKILVEAIFCRKVDCLHTYTDETMTSGIDCNPHPRGQMT